MEKRRKQKEENIQLQNQVSDISSRVNLEKKYLFFISKLNSNQQYELINYLVYLNSSSDSVIKTKSIKRK